MSILYMLYRLEMMLLLISRKRQFMQIKDLS